MLVPQPTSRRDLSETSRRLANSTYSLRVGANTPDLGVKRPSSPRISMPSGVHSARLRVPNRLLRDMFRGSPVRPQASRNARWIRGAARVFTPPSGPPTTVSRPGVSALRPARAGFPRPCAVEPRAPAGGSIRWRRRFLTASSGPPLGKAPVQTSPPALRGSLQRAASAPRASSTAASAAAGVWPVSVATPTGGHRGG